MGYCTIITRYVAKWGIAQMCLCETKYQRGVSHHLGGVLNSFKKYRAIWGIAAIVSQYRAIWGHYGARKCPEAPGSLPGSLTEVCPEVPGILRRNSPSHHPVGQKRHLDVARQKLPRDNFCLSIVSLTLTTEVTLKDEKMPSLVGERQSRRQFGRG